MEAIEAGKQPRGWVIHEMLFVSLREDARRQGGGFTEASSILGLPFTVGTPANDASFELHFDEDVAPLSSASSDFCIFAAEDGNLKIRFT